MPYRFLFVNFRQKPVFMHIDLKHQDITIFIVEDNLMNTKIIESMLKQTGYMVHTASNGVEALEKLEVLIPDLILLDIIMPGLDGFEVIKRIKANPYQAHIPVIFITAQMDTADLVKGFQLGGVDFITKPVQKGELLSRMNTHLELKFAREKIEKQAKELQHALNEVDSSMRYAGMIQGAIFPKRELFDKYFEEYAIWFKPWGRVSGDFYWIREIDDHLLFAVGDCTGHGVPGALLSILSISALNEISLLHDISPNQMLDVLRERVKHSLNQQTFEHGIIDGLNIALLKFHPQRSFMEFSGAFHSIFHFSTKSNSLHKIEADRMPVSVYINEQPFSLTKLDVKPGDMLYLFSDGVPDQLGGPKGKKYSLKRLRTIIEENIQKPVSEQLDALNTDWMEWKGNEPQTDDTLLLAVKIP